MKKLLFMLVMTLSLSQVLSAQNYEFDNVQRASTGGIQAIKDGNEVKGYISVMYLDNVSRKEKLYGISILDANLQQTHYKEITLDKRDYLVSQAFNNNSFCLAFLNSKKKSIDYVIYDLALEETGRLTCEDVNPNDLATAGNAPEDDKLNFSGLNAVPGKGYIRMGYTKAKGYKVSIQMFDNSGEILWSAGTGYTGKMYEAGETMFVGEKITVSSIVSKKSAFTPKMECVLVAHDLNTGDEIYKINASDTKHQMFPYDVSYVAEQQKFIVCGEYYKTGDNMLKVKSQGFYIQEYSSEDGKLLKTSLVNWTRDVARKMPANKKGGFKDMDVSIHKMLITSDGKVYAIGEQFKKSVSALGVASQVLSRGQGGIAAMQVEIHDMMVFEFDTELKLEKVHVFDKETSKIALPQGYSMLRGYLLATILKIYGGFDHCYTSVTNDATNFNSVFVDYNRETMTKGSYKIGVVGRNGEGEVSDDEYKLDTTPSLFYVVPAKPGYVAIVEYFRKESKLTIRLEKVNLD